MSSDEIIIHARNICKRFQIYTQPQDRLKQVVFPRLFRFAGRTARNYFSEFSALHDVSFDVKRGETVGIVGCNGSGKSTLLQIICGILEATTGEVQTRGQIAPLLELGSGFNPEFTGLDNVNLYGQLLGMSQDVISERLPGILDFAGIGDYVSQPVKTYSSGMVVRLAFAVSIAREPDILVVDEALAVGDEAFQRKCFSRINQLRKTGTTVLFVSHSAGLVVELCDRVILLDAGELLYDGTPKTTVAFYHKLVYAEKEKKEKIRNEIRAREIDRAVQSEPPSIPAKIIKKKDAISSPTPFFDPNFVSQSLLEYESLGVRIHAPRIETISGKRVNNLICGDQYVFSYTVKCFTEVSHVQFGMLIKSTSGLEMGGASHPSLFESLSSIKKNSELIVCFNFRCMLNPGAYFVNAGVLGEVKGKTAGYLHRLIDAVVFRVQPEKGRNGTGRVNFDISSTICEQAGK